MHPVIHFNLDSPVPVIAMRMGDTIGLIFNPTFYATMTTDERDIVLNAAIYQACGVTPPQNRRATDKPVARVIDLETAREIRLCRTAAEAALAARAGRGTS